MTATVEKTGLKFAFNPHHGAGGRFTSGGGTGGAGPTTPSTSGASMGLLTARHAPLSASFGPTTIAEARAVFPSKTPASVTQHKTQGYSQGRRSEAFGDRSRGAGQLYKTRFTGPKGSLTASLNPRGMHRLETSIKGGKYTDRKGMSASQAKTALSFAVKQIAA